MNGPCTVCDGRCGGLHDDDTGMGDWCHCLGCEHERHLQGKRSDEMYSWWVWYIARSRTALKLRHLTKELGGPWS